MSARECTVYLINNTVYDLTLDSNNEYVDHGYFTENPPTTIPAGTTGHWKSNSDGFMTGTEGHVGYFINDDEWNDANDTPKNWVYVHWDDPYAGHNSYSTDVSDKDRYSCSQNGDISGNHSTMHFTLVSN